MLPAQPVPVPNRWPGRARRLAFVAAVLLVVPSLNAPLLEDDVIQRAMLLDKAPGVRWGPLDLYDFVGGPRRPAALLRDRGLLPWFCADDLRLRFFRPLSSAVLAADVRVFGEHLWVSRLHSLAWFLAILVIVDAVYRRLLSPSSAALATLIYALAVGHLMPLVWIAARHTLICTTLALLTVWFHLRVRQDAWRRGRGLSWLAFVGALLAGEMGLGAVALIATWEISGARDSRRQRLLALLPFVGIASAYLGCYLWMGYGVRGTGGYVSVNDGFRGAGVLLRHWIILIGELAAAMPSDLAGAASAPAQMGAAAAAVVATAAAAGLFAASRQQMTVRDAAAIRWLAAAAAAAAIPGAFALIGGRVLTLALVPSSAVIAIILRAALSTIRRGALTRVRRLIVTGAVAAFAGAHLIAAPILRLGGAALLADVARRQQELASHTPRCDGVMAIVAAADPIAAMYVPVTMTLRNRGPERLRVLSMAPRDHRIERVTESGFDLVTLGGARTRTLWERLYGARPMPAGTQVALTGLTATVLEDRDGVESRVRFDFGEPLADGRVCLLTWDDGRLARLPRPEPGSTILLPHVPGPLGW